MSRSLVCLLTFADPADYDRLSQSEKLSFAGVHAALRQGASLSASRADGGSIALQHALSPRCCLRVGSSAG